jgi:hypothetical protein
MQQRCHINTNNASEKHIPARAKDGWRAAQVYKFNKVRRVEACPFQPSKEKKINRDHNCA